jgi:ketosteroid isomerase-like protein
MTMRGEMIAEKIVHLHTEGFNRALMEQDYKSLESIYSEAYMLVRPDGSVPDKRQVLRDLQERGLTFHAIELHDTVVRTFVVRTFGPCAILTAESKTASSRDGNTVSAQFRLVAVYAEEGDGIRLVHFQSTPLP